MITIVENGLMTLLPAAGGVLMALSSQTDMGVIVGASLAAAGVAGALGMLLAGAIKEYEIPRLTGLKRLAVNFLAGICSIPFVSHVHRSWFPDEEIGMVAAGLSGAVALLGVTVLTIGLPALIKRIRGRAREWEGDSREPRMVIPSRRTTSSNTDTVNLAPPNNPNPPTQP